MKKKIVNCPFKILMIFTFILYFIIKVLDVKDIPVFMTNLSNATEKNDKVIAQSPATVQSIVGILLTFSNVSKTIFINQPVMEVCTLQCVSVHNTSVKLWLVKTL